MALSFSTSDCLRVTSVPVACPSTRKPTRSQICVPAALSTSHCAQGSQSSALLGQRDGLLPRRISQKRGRSSAVIKVRAAALKEDEYIVELEKPLGIKFYKGEDGATYVDAMVPGQSAASSGLITEGDKILETSAVFGDDMWPAAEYGRTMYSIRQRIGTVAMKVQKKFGERAPEFVANDAYLKERNAGDYGDALREKQIENYLRKTELAEQRQTEMDEGLRMYKQGSYAEALVHFETLLALEPPPREEGVASYNAACCLSKLGKVESGLGALEAAMRAGFEDYRAIRSDADLADLRASPAFKPLMDKYDEPLINENALKAITSVFGLFGGKK
eukprot:TRINITY_DN32515_c0_g1_i1.p1 TRINITY_DN32515_c0_g1~~TRINITY_DN32515_c0_g1_i1.p1  ORF type:complete len:376 (+),score=55.06 TRINITY_DN32515_c0_g1_i1:132-1130(+)